MVCLVSIDIFWQNFRKNAQKVLKRLSNICKQHKCQINSIFVSYTWPLSQNFIHNRYSFYAHNNRINCTLSCAYCTLSRAPIFSVVNWTTRLIIETSFYPLSKKEGILLCTFLSVGWYVGLCVCMSACTYTLAVCKR